MKYLIISGIDGSGKSSVIDCLKARLEKQGYRVECIWMRYNHYLVKCMNALARLLRLSVKVHNEYGDVWEHRLYRSPLFCKLYFWCSYIDNIIAKRKVAKLKADYVICDRWVNDIIIDLGAECRKDDILESKWFDRFQRLLPRRDCHQFVVKRELDDVLGCRIENHTNPDFRYRWALYEKLQEKPEVHVVDNCGTLENSIEQIFDVMGNRND